METLPVILDTDFGSDVDDAVALALALASPELDLRGVSVVGRQSLARADLARRYLALAGRADVPVAAGVDQPRRGPQDAGPLSAEVATRLNWFDIEGTGPLGAPLRLDAPARLAEWLAAGPAEVVAVGPLGNLAAAFAADPALPARIFRLTVMGGCPAPLVFADRALPVAVDYNLCADPWAAAAVLRAPVPLRLVSAEATLQCWFGAAELAALEALPHPFARALAGDIRAWEGVQRGLFAYERAACDNVCFLHDPLTVLTLLEPGVVVWERAEAEFLVDAAGVLRTLLHAAPVPGHTRPVEIARRVDAPRARAAILERLRRRFA